MVFKDDEQRRAYFREYNKGWYQRHKDKILERRLEKRKKRELNIRDWFRTYKSELYCMECGENHPACLQFHHRDKEEKSFIISNAVLRGTSIKTLIKEIKKCDVLCVNCHAKLHWRETHEADDWEEIVPPGE
jgi:hypothetical protein